ncbi:MAG: hypothetical protein ACPL3B_05860, partial [Fervidobacterium sp.]
MENSSFEEKFLEQYKKYLHASTVTELQKLIQKRSSEKTPLSKLKEGDSVTDREVLIMNKVMSKTVVKCPECGKSFRDSEPGTIVKCTSKRCGGKEVTLEAFEVEYYTCSDNSGGAILYLVPKLMGVDRDLEGYVAKVSGNVGSGRLKSYPDYPII